MPRRGDDLVVTEGDDPSVRCGSPVTARPRVGEAVRWPGVGHQRPVLVYGR